MERDRRVVIRIQNRNEENLFDTRYDDIDILQRNSSNFDLNESLSGVNFFVERNNFFEDVKLMKVSASCQILNTIFRMIG